MADQDDYWHADKLEALLAEIGHAGLVYSDARIVAPDGSMRAETYCGERRNNHSDALSLLVANVVTGAASLIPRRLLDDALPFPPRQFSHFHNHWIALTAHALGEIRFVDNHCTTTCSTARRCSATRPRPGCRSSLTGRADGCAGGPLGGCASGGCTTTWTAAG